MTSRRLPRVSLRAQAAAIALGLLLLASADRAQAGTPPETVPQYATGIPGELIHPGTVSSPGLVDLLAFVADADGDPLSVTAASVAAADGALTLHADGTATYLKPAPSFSGQPVVSFRVSDGTTAVDFTLLLDLEEGGDPTSPPAAPSGLSAAPDLSAGSPRVILTWVDGSTNEDGFEIHRQSSTESSFSLLSTVAANTASAVDSAVVAGESYTYFVRAFNAAGHADSGTATADVPVPSLVGPAGLEAVTGTTPDGDGTVTLTWTDRDAVEDGFHVYRRAGTTGGRILLATLAADAEAYTDEGVAAGTYTYEVESFRGGGPAEVSPAAAVTVEVESLPKVDAQDDPAFFDDPRFRTETDVELFICPVAFLENDAPQTDISLSLPQAPAPGFPAGGPDHGTDGWDYRESACPEGTSDNGILYRPDSGYCGTDQFLYRLYYIGTETPIEDLATITVRINQPPTPAFTPGCDGLHCSLDATASTDDCSSVPTVVSPGIVSYEWFLDGQIVGNGPTLELDLPASGTYQITLTVEDTEGSRRSASQQVEAGLPPTAAFTDDCSAGDLTCTLDASSSTDPDGAVVSWTWDFGDGTSDDRETVTHLFPDSGVFDVRLTVTDDQGLSDSVVRPVTVPPVPPVAAFDVDCSGGLVCAFDASPSSDLDGTVVAWEWSFGDGGPLATAAQPSHTYSVRGTYTVTLTVTDDDGLQASHSEPVTVSALPVPDFTYDCTGLTCDFDASTSTDDGAVTLYSWRFATEGDASGVTATHAFLAKGIYEVTLLVEDDGGQSAETSRQVEVSKQPVASFVVACTGMSCAFDASGSSDDGTIVSYDWDFGDGTTDSGQMVGHSFAEGQDFLVILTVADDLGQTATTQRWLRQPVAAFSRACDGLVCTFDASASTDDEPLAAYEWVFGDGASDSGPAVEHPYAVKGAYTATLTVIDSLGLEDTATETFTISEKPAASFTYACDELACDFDASGSSDDGPIQTYTWRFGNDLGNGDGELAPFTFPAKGDYLVRLSVTDAEGQVSMIEKTVSVSLNPAAVITSSCDGLSCNFDGSGSTDDGTIVRYEWTFGDGTTYEGPTPPPHVYPVKGTYTVTLTVTDDHDQSSSESIPVTVSEKPVAVISPWSFSGLTGSFDGSSSTDDGSIVSYLWTFGDGASASGPIVSHTWATYGTYTVTLTVTDDMGQQGSDSLISAISDLPTASFTHDNCPNQTCTFDGTGSSDDVGITSWTWEFGDGTTGSGPTVTHPFPPGVVSSVVTLTVTDDLGQAGSDTREVPIEPPDIDLPVASGGTWEFYSPTNIGIGLTEQIPITNVGPNDLHLANRGNMVSGSCFHQVTTPPAVVAPGQTVTVGVEMECASGHLYGNKTGTLTIRSDDPDEDPYTLTIRGEMVGGSIPRIRLEASYSPGPGQPRQGYVSETAHPTDEVAFYFDPNLGGFEERLGGTCGGTDNPTFVKVRLDNPVNITGCTFKMSWDETVKTCSSAIVDTLRSGQEVVINTDEFLTDPATCKLIRPLSSHVRHGEDHHVKVTFQYGSGDYPRRIDIRQSSRVDYLPINQDVGVLQNLPDLNLGQSWSFSVSGQSYANAYGILKVSPAVAGTYRSAALWLEGSYGTPPATSVHQLRRTGGWSEDTLTWNNWSSATGGVLRYVSSLVAHGSAARANVGSVVTGSGTFAFRLRTTTSSSYTFYSSEASGGPPYLVVTTTP